MNANTTQNMSKGMTIALWIGQIVVAGILGMGAFMKFFNYTPEGSMALADAMHPALRLRSSAKLYGGNRAADSRLRIAAAIEPD